MKLKPGDKVLVLLQIQTEKLSKWKGPYKVLCHHFPVVLYTLDQHHFFKWVVHDMVTVLYLSQSLLVFDV